MEKSEEGIKIKQCKDYAIKHRIASQLWEESDKFDPFQVFEVCETKCNRLKVHVINGTNITDGYIGDLIDSPDPYLLLSVPNTPNGSKRTRSVDNCRNPIWDNIFYFYIDPDIRNNLSMVLMDANDVLYDRKLGHVTITLDDLKLNVEMDTTVMFSKGAKVRLKLCKETNCRPELRCSLALCDEEKDFLRKRRKRVLQGMQTFLGAEHGPKVERETPCVAVLGSGGGMRAAIAYSAVCKALQELQVLDCVMFIASLSGSSWYLSYLYSQQEFPEKGPKDFQAELRDQLQENLLKFLVPTVLYDIISSMLKKCIRGQPISLTDLFGHIVGNLLLKEKKNLKLSQQRKVLDAGQAPLPLYTCINVKKNVSARVFQEWFEFSPYEVGVAKYGTYTKPENFGSKFYLGNVIKKFEEPPLHYLLGIWGSAYSILFNRLVRECCKVGSSQDEEYEEATEVSEDYIPGSDELNKMNNDSGTSDSEVESHDSDNSDSEDIEDTLLIHETYDFIATERKIEEKDRQALFSEANSAQFKEKYKKPWKVRKLMKRRSKQDVQKTVWEATIQSILTNSLTNSRVLRAGVVYNIFRGLQLQNTSPLPPLTPTKPYDEDDFKGFCEATEMKNKKLFLVDSGLTFNLPFPLLLRPQRAVDLYLCFDFSLRKYDKDSPFDELLIAEKWARLAKVPFPSIQQKVKHLKRPFEECYVFKDQNDPHCPVVLFFPLVNNKFRSFKSPGVKRETKEEIEFGAFDIFSDPKKPYDTFKFQFTHEEFDRLTSLVEFNIHDNKHLIEKYMKMAVTRKCELLPKMAFSMDDVQQTKLRPKSEQLMKQLESYMQYMSKIHKM